MTQFDVVINNSKNGKSEVPYLLVLQSDAVIVLETRLVAPLRRDETYSNSFIHKVHIKIKISGISYIAFISEAAAVPASYLGEFILSASHLKTEIISAIDLLFTGF